MWFPPKGQSGSAINKDYTQTGHVGIVTGVGSNGQITTIDGNTSGPGSGSGAINHVVNEKPRPRKVFVGFGVPNYTTESTTDLKSDTVNFKILEFFLKQGYSDAAVAGIFGNLATECYLDKNGQIKINTREKGGAGVGLCQWTNASRKKPFLSYIKTKGFTLDTAPIEVQLEYMQLELEGKYGNVWMLPPGGVSGPNYQKALKGKNARMGISSYKNINDPVYATGVFCANFERPKDADSMHMDRRIREANRAMGMIRQVKQNMNKQ